MFSELLRTRLGSLVELSSIQIKQLERHYELLSRWNRVLNLTTVVKVEEVVERHYFESLFLASHLPAGCLRIADIGSGAGFPGIPIAVVRPESMVVLIESHRRKCVFLREATRGMGNARVLPARAEQVSERFDWAVSRGVSYADLRPLLSRLAENVGLLAGAGSPPDLRFTWNNPILLPWGKRRFLWIGHSVPRQTR